MTCLALLVPPWRDRLAGMQVDSSLVCGVELLMIPMVLRVKVLGTVTGTVDTVMVTPPGDYPR